MVMNVISVLLVVLILCALISVPVGLFNLKIFQAVHGAKCTGLNFLKAFTPFYNITFSRKLTYGRTPIYNWAMIICAVLLAFRFTALLLVSAVPILVVYSSITTFSCIVLYWGFYLVNAVDFCRMFNCGVVTTLCSIVVPPIGYYMISTQVLGYFRNVEDMVSGRFGD